LIADADADTRLLYREHLFDGWDVLEAGDGREALVKALVRSPEFVVTELLLPLLDGFELCEILRCDRVTRDAAIMVVTTETRPTEIRQALAAGADAVVPKPASLERLQEEMRVLKRARAARTRASAAHTRAGDQLERSAALLAQSEQLRRTPLSKAHVPQKTSAPPIAPLDLACPLCNAPLRYVASHVAGLNEGNPEQWDTLDCHTCGRFEYRQRARLLRPMRPYPSK
jgi:CheY-like chemotaxis protein